MSDSRSSSRSGSPPSRSVSPTSTRRSRPFPSTTSTGVIATVDHLVELGHRSLAHVAGSSDHAPRASPADGVRRACAARGVDGRVVETDFSAREGGEATTRLICGCRDPPDGDHVLERPDGAGRHRGGAAVRGCPFPATSPSPASTTATSRSYVYPSLTSVATDAVEWGALAARTLLAAIAGIDARRHRTRARSPRGARVDRGSRRRAPALDSPPLARQPGRSRRRIG